MNDSPAEQRMTVRYARVRNRIIAELVMRLGHLTHIDAELEARLARMPAARADLIRGMCEQSSDGLAESLSDWLRADGASAFTPAPREAVLPPHIVRDATPAKPFPPIPEANQKPQTPTTNP